VPQPRVVVVGSINVDLVVAVDNLPAAGETVTGGRFARHGGGKGANQAVAAARLGAAVSMVGAVGQDELGDEAVNELAAEGIDVTAVARVDAPTGVALIVVDRAGENQIAVASGANAALSPTHVTTSLSRLLGTQEGAGPPPGEAAAAGDTAAAGAPEGDGVVLLGHEVPEEVVVAAAQAAAEAGWRVVLNPAPARPLPEAALAMITPNASEAAQLTGETNSEAAARALTEQTEAAVLVTLGAHGALLVEPGGEPQTLPATQVEVVDTTGAGDTVNGALAVELAAGRPFPEAARFALNAAALSTRKPGARGGMPRREEIDG
jgi:ribokinase